MTGDPPPRPPHDIGPEESDRRLWMHDYERHVARLPEQPGPDRPDPIHVLRFSVRGRPGADMYVLARWSVTARLCRDAEGSGDTVTDLGPDAMPLAQAAQRGEWPMGALLPLGMAEGGRWLTWNLAGEPPPVPGR